MKNLVIGIAFTKLCVPIQAVRLLVWELKVSANPTRGLKMTSCRVCALKFKPPRQFKNDRLGGFLTVGKVRRHAKRKSHGLISLRQERKPQTKLRKIGVSAKKCLTNTVKCGII